MDCIMCDAGRSHLARGREDLVVLVGRVEVGQPVRPGHNSRRAHLERHGLASGPKLDRKQPVPDAHFCCTPLFYHFGRRSQHESGEVHHQVCLIVSRGGCATCG